MIRTKLLFLLDQTFSFPKRKGLDLGGFEPPTSCIMENGKHSLPCFHFSLSFSFMKVSFSFSKKKKVSAMQARYRCATSPFTLSVSG